MQAADVVEIPGFLTRSIVKKFIFGAEGVTIENAGIPFFLPAEKISAFRYGVKWTTGYKFVFGRQYFIELKDFQNKVYKIRLSSIYGIRRNTYYDVWSEIFKQLWNHYFVNMLHYYTDLYNIGQPFELAGINVDAKGISWDRKHQLDWKDVGISNYRTYFMLYNAGNPREYKSCSFDNDWNARILQVLLKAILKKRKITPKSINK
jgi:hypothetical protein